MPATVSMTNAIVAVRSLLDEASAVYWSDTELTTWINEGCLEVSRRAEILWNIDSISVTALTQTYNCPADFLNGHRSQFTPTGSTITYPCEYRRYNAMDDEWGILPSLPAAWPRFWTMWEKTDGSTGLIQPYVMLYPSPGQSGTLQLFYYRAAAAVTGTTNIDTQPGWQDIVYDYAIYRARRKDRDPDWQAAKGIYEANLAEMMNRTRDLTDLADVMQTGNVGYPPLYAMGGESSDGW